MAINGALIRSKPFKVTPIKVTVTDEDGRDHIGIEFEIERNVQPTDKYNNENIEFITEQEYIDLENPDDLRQLTKYSERIKLRYDITDADGNPLEDDKQTGGPYLIDQNTDSYVGKIGSNGYIYEFIYYSYLNE